MGLLPGMLGGRGMGLAWRNGFAGAYDAIPSIAAAYGMRRLLASYTGSLIRLRRSSDNAESDFGYDGGGHLDTAAIATWVGGGSGYVVTWYDQSGNEYDATQGTAGSQPLYVASGQNSRPVARFDGVDDRLRAATFTDLPDEASALTASKLANDQEAFLDISNGSSTNTGFTPAFHESGAVAIRVISGGSKTQTGSDQRGAWHVFASVYDASVATTLFVDGSSDAAFSTPPGALDNTLSNLWIGSLHGGAYPLTGDIAEVIVASAAWATGQRQAAESAANAYWSIY